MHELLLSMIDDTDVLETQTIMSLSWILLGNCAQYWSVRTSADDVYDRRFPKSTLQFIMPGFKIHKHISMPRGTPKEWRAAPASKKREREQDTYRRGNDRNQHNSNGAADWHNEVHPKIKAMMEPYRKVHDTVRFGRICHKAGVKIYDMPQGFRNKCFHHMLGKCHVGEDNCDHKHVAGSALAEEDVDAFVKKVKPGVVKVTEEGPISKGRGNKRKRGKRDE